MFAYIYIYYILLYNIIILCRFLNAMHNPADRGHMQEETSRMMQNGSVCVAGYVLQGVWPKVPCSDCGL